VSDRTDNTNSATATLAKPRTSSENADVPLRRQSRVGIVAVMILALLASAGARYLADAQRAIDIPNHGETGARSSFSNMNSFALGLMLGGLRGPLVMFLWTESETAKSEKNLEGVDTQIEWIRLLQPEFDTVHIFQIWNKAYNISVQMASLANKYSVILDALDYARSIDRDKPDDINIIAAMAQIYFDKLGGSNEKLYYRRRVREESKPHAVASKTRPQDTGWRRDRMDPLLDSNFNLLPNLIQPQAGRARPANLPADQEWNDGSDLQYLAKYQPFIDGVSPLALAYNYYKRAEVLQNVGKQRHAQLSDMVIDTRPGLTLKTWSEEEWEQGRRREAQGFGLAVPEERADLEGLSQDFAVDHPITNPADIKLAIFAYDRAALLDEDAKAEYLRNVRINPLNAENQRSQIDDIGAEQALVSADRDYLIAMIAAPADQKALLEKASAEYHRSITLYEQIILRYYTDPQYVQSALPPGFGRIATADHKGIADMTSQQTSQAIAIANQAHGGQRDSHDEDRQDYQRYIERANTRLAHLP
jgi:hypothetical protein